MEKSKILKGAVIAAVVALAGGTLAGCTSDKFTADEVDDKIAMALEDASIDSELALVGAINDAVAEALAEVEPEIVIETVTEYVDKNVTVEVEVDNGNMDLVLDHLFDNRGNVTYLVDDMDDDEVDEIVERVVFINDIKELALKEVDSDGEDELDNEVVEVGGENITLDDRDIDRFRLYDDADEIVVMNVDFKDKDADVYVDARFEHDHERYYARFLVEFKDGEADDIEVYSVAAKKEDLKD